MIERDNTAVPNQHHLGSLPPLVAPYLAICPWNIKTASQPTHVSPSEIEQKLKVICPTDRLVLIDVHGTLVPRGKQADILTGNEKQSLRELAGTLSDNGIGVGLYSDAPVAYLAGLAQKLGLSGPVLGERGSALADLRMATTVKFATVPKQNLLKTIIADEVADLDPGYKQKGDSIPPELGGVSIDFKQGEWSLGYGRECSIAVYGPDSMLSRLLDTLSNHEDFESCSFDLRPGFNYLGIFARSDSEYGLRGAALQAIGDVGTRVVSVSSSRSAWMPNIPTVSSVFVNDAFLDTGIRTEAKYVSEMPLISGVLDILNRVAFETACSR